MPLHVVKEVYCSSLVAGGELTSRLGLPLGKVTVLTELNTMIGSPVATLVGLMKGRT